MHAGLKDFIEAKKHEYDTEILPNFITHIGEKTLDASQLKCVKEFIFVERKVAERKMETQAWSNRMDDMRNFCVDYLDDFDQSIFDIFDTIADELRVYSGRKTVDMAEKKLDQFAFDLNAGFCPDPGAVNYFYVLSSQYAYVKETMLPDLDVVFFDLINIAKQGHLACFWDGKFPNGTLWVY